MSEDLVGLAIGVAAAAVPILIGIVAGGQVVRAHLRQLDERERELSDILACDLEELPGGEDAAQPGRLVLGHVVLGCDHFRVLLGGLASLVGGEVRAFSRLLERARREAVLRLKQEARRQGCDAVLNVRLDTCSVGMGRGVAVEVLASGTAVRRRR